MASFLFCEIKSIQFVIQESGPSADHSVHKFFRDEHSVPVLGEKEMRLLMCSCDGFNDAFNRGLLFDCLPVYCVIQPISA